MPESERQRAAGQPDRRRPALLCRPPGGFARTSGATHDLTAVREHGIIGALAEANPDCWADRSWQGAAPKRFLVQYGLVRDAGATVASMVTCLVPLVSTVAGVAVLGKGPKWHQPVGAVVILLAAALPQRTSVRST
ncbi:hypothetical protein GCM10010129_78310 [Streptomyces fumigatiscleroticus]|nr:hypothetical protein GCM10010129_78310 [Streptomyces fumigatiscleroticus]